ncbi:hypothetical protein QJQ45_009342, partial [Haematococcus lacustris]
MGSRAVAIGSRAVAIGSRAIAIGSRAIAMGSRAVAIGSRAVAIGSRAIAIGSRAVAIGSRAETTGSRAETTGSRAETTGSRAANVLSNDPVPHSHPSSSPSNNPINYPTSIPPAVAAQLTTLISEFEDVFAPFNKLPPQRPVGHTIPLQPGCKPPALPSYKMSQPELLEMKKQVAAFLEQGIIEPSSSPYAAPVLFVKKKSGELRMCVDYRQLNKITLRDQYPLPRVDDLFDRLAGCTVFSSLDLQAGYHQIRIPDEDVPKTAFRTPTGLYQFKVLCFGLTNAPATFQRVMNNAFADVINDCALVYIDDILIMSKSVPDHFNHLRRVLELLRKHQFQAKLSKCEFLKTALEFLGHIVSDQGIAVDPDK